MQNYSTTVDIGKGYKKIESGQKVKYFDQYFSFASCKWKSTTKKIGEELIVSYIPTRRATNIITFAWSIIKKILGK